MKTGESGAKVQQDRARGVEAKSLRPDLYDQNQLIIRGLGKRGLSPELSDKDMLFTRAEAAAYLRCSIATMERWASHGGGPPFQRVGGRALYALAALRCFAGVKPDEISTKK